MSEIYLEMDLRLPIETAPQIIEVLERSNPNLTSSNLISEFAVFGPESTHILKLAMIANPDWMDESMDLATHLRPNDFNHDGKLAKIQYISFNEQVLEGLGSFLTQVFVNSGIVVANTEIFSEEDLDEYEFVSEAVDEFSHLEF